MRVARRTFRAAGLAALSCGWLLVLFVCSGLLVAAPQRRRAARDRIMRWWARQCLWLLGGRLQIEGTPPQGAYFLVSNHLSYIDVLVLAAQLSPVFIAKAEVRRWPGLGFLARSAGTLFIHRQRRRDVTRVNDLVAELLDRGHGIVLFPESTSTQGAGVLRFRSPLLAYPAQVGAPVHPAAITYATPDDELPAHLSVAWWGDAPFLAHAMRLLGQRGFEARIRFGEPVTAEGDRKWLTRELQARVEALFEPLVDPERPATETGL